MNVHLFVQNIEWMEGCEDSEDHDHPPELEAYVDIPGEFFGDQLALEHAIHIALIEQCDCCIVDCTLGYIECDQKVGETVEGWDRPPRYE